MKLSAYARSLGVSYRTAWRWFKAGKVAGFQADTGTLIVTEAIVETVPASANPKTVIDTRVSAAENKDHLEGQAKRRMDYCAAKGYQVTIVVQEIGSGVNDTLSKLLKWLSDPTVGQIVVEPKDRLTRFGFNSSEQWLAMQGRKIETVASNAIKQRHQATPSSNAIKQRHQAKRMAENGKEDLIQDFVSIVTSFCARLYGQRRSKHKTERILSELQNEEGHHPPQTRPG